VDADRFRDCFEEKRYDDEIGRDLGDGRAAGVQSTPTFVIVAPDGSTERIVGPQPVETFVSAIEDALAKATTDANESGSNGSGEGEANQTGARAVRR
jgi:predicted DsbA family dithiol-disulfide isomerase